MASSNPIGLWLFTCFPLPIPFKKTRWSFVYLHGNFEVKVNKRKVYLGGEIHGNFHCPTFNQLKIFMKIWGEEQDLSLFDSLILGMVYLSYLNFMLNIFCQQ